MANLSRANAARLAGRMPYQIGPYQIGSCRIGASRD